MHTYTYVYIHTYTYMHKSLQGANSSNDVEMSNGDTKKENGEPKEEGSLKAELAKSPTDDGGKSLREFISMAENQDLLQRPNVSYATLIAQSLFDSPEQKLMLADIYEWIIKNYPYYGQPKAGSWQNSVRHNLSLNECFHKKNTPGPKGKRIIWWTVKDDMKDHFNIKGEYFNKKKIKSGHLPVRKPPVKKQIPAKPSSTTANTSDPKIAAAGKIL